VTISFIYGIFNIAYTMNEIEEIVRDRIVIELEDLKRELVKEAKQRRKRRRDHGRYVFEI